MKLRDFAQQVMDAYYQDYAPDDAFFDLDYFVSMCVSAYGKVLNDGYETAKLVNRQMLGFSFVQLSADLLEKKVLEIQYDKEFKEYYAPLCNPVYMFPFDSMATSVVNIRPIGNACGQFVKISVDDRWQICHLPKNTYSFFSVYVDRIVFDVLACKDLKQVEMLYAPAFSSADVNVNIPDSATFVIQTMVLQQMIGAREGTIIDTTNDTNNNKAPQTELDKNKIS